MTFSPRTYLHNWSLYLRGVRWLWSREWGRDGLYPAGAFSEALDIRYKPGWGPWRFLPVYLTTYLVAVLCGLGVVSLSRWWYDRSLWFLACGERVAIWTCEKSDMNNFMRWRHPFSRFMTRLLDRLFPGSAHGRHTGPKLWGSKSAWE